MGRRRAVVHGGERYAAYGCPEGQEASPDAEEFCASREPDALPAKVDLRKYCTEVEDQKNSNSCCANAVAGAFEYLAARAAAETGEEVGDASRLFIYYVGRKSDLQSQGMGSRKVADEGMSISGAIRAMACKGTCTADAWPFELDNVNSRPPEEAFDEAIDFKISKGISIPVEADVMKQCLADGYPIIFGLKLTARFFSPGSAGIISVPNLDDPQSASHGLHAMLCVGYSDPDQVFIVRNSWGTSWGHEGYCYIPYDYMANPDFNFCGQYAIKGLTDYDLTPDDEEDADSPLVNADDDDGEDEPELEDEDEEVEDDEEDDDDDGDMFDKEAEAQRVFNLVDTSGNGSISMDEFGLLLRKCGVYCPKAQLQELMDAFNADGKEGLSFDEFHEMLGQLGW